MPGAERTNRAGEPGAEETSQAGEPSGRAGRMSEAETWGPVNSEPGERETRRDTGYDFILFSRNCKHGR